jgi:hypothetical protein
VGGSVSSHQVEHKVVGDAFKKRRKEIKEKKE